MEGEQQPEPSQTATKDRPVVWDSWDLLKGQREAWIEHNGELYRLRLTALGKLLLTK